MMSETEVREGSMEDPIASGPPEDATIREADTVTEIAPDERLWDPDGPTKAVIDTWKEEYIDVYVTSVTPERHFVWRTLRRSEYRQLVQRMEQQIADGMSQAVANMNNEEAVAELCILAPPYNRSDPKTMAGVASIIAQEVLEASGFSALDVRTL